MGEIKSRSIRLDDENWEWLSNLPGKTSNDAITALRGAGVVVDDLGKRLDGLQRAVEQILVREQVGSRTGLPGKVEGSKGGLEPLDAPEPGFNPCRHCGLDGQISPRTNQWRACSGCQRDGHFNISDCRRCAEIAHAKKLAASPSGVDDPSVDYGWKEPA